MTASSALLLLPLLCVGAALGNYAPEHYNVEYDEAKELGEKFVGTEELVGAGHHGGVVGYNSYGGIIKEVEHEEVEGYQSKNPYNPHKVFEHIIGLKEEPRCSIRGPKECNPHERYRSIDGTCNNLLRPTLGAAGTTYSRLLPPRYSAGTCEPGRSVTGYPLPLSRKLSRELFPSKPINDPRHTMLTVHWGQVVVHDTTLIAGNSQTKPNRKRCCTLDGRRLQNRHDPACYAIVVDERDPVYAPAGVRCMNLVRTTRDACSKRGTEQLNDVTAFLDLSLVYGSDRHTAKSLRLFKTGLLKMGLSSVGRSVLPPAHNSSEVCDLVSPHEACYRAGDIRVNQNPQHTLLQTVLLREHNRVALALAHLNPHWGDERVYQEARRILIAEHQHITYTEYLPVILGWDAMKRYGVWQDGHEHAWDYDPKTDPSVLNEHAAAAFRFLHTNIQGLLSLVTEHRKSFNTLRLSDHFSRPDVIQRANNFDHLLRGLTTQCQHGTDRFATEETMQFMFRNGRKLGLDLCAIDTQRSRDHGIASYNDMRHYCGLHKAHSWEGFKDLIEHELVEKMSRLYKHPDDVDLIVGGSLETIVHGAQFGPTFLCITAEQFRRTRRGDRFFYHFKSAGFTPEQLKEIKKSNAARLLCDNSDGIKLMQPKAFWKISDENPLVPCKKLPAMDLRAWKEEKGKFFEVHGDLKEAEHPWKDFHDKLPVYGPWPEGHDVWKKDDLPLYEVKDKFPKGHSGLSDIEKPWKDIHDEFPSLFGPWQEDHDVWKNDDVPFLEELNDWKKTDSPWVGSVGDWKGEAGDQLWPDKKAYWGEGNHASNDNPLGWKGLDGKWGDDYSDWAKGDSDWNLDHNDFKDLYSPVLSNLKGAASWKGNLGGLKDIEIPFVKGYSGLKQTDDLWTDGDIDLKYDDGWEKDYKNWELGDETWKEDIEDWKDEDGPWDQEYKVKKARGDVDDNFKVKVSLAID